MFLHRYVVLSCVVLAVTVSLRLPSVSLWVLTPPRWEQQQLDGTPNRVNRRSSVRSLQEQRPEPLGRYNEKLHGRKDFASKPCDGPQWAVMTTILEINPAVERIANAFKDVCLMVVGDLKTNHTLWQDFEQLYVQKHNTVVYLSPWQQENLNYKISKYLPWNHFGRKTIGMMSAIQHGAELIYDFDDDNHLNEDITNFDQAIGSLKMHKLDVSHHLFNPYPVEKTNHNKKNILWPRGLPLQFITDSDTYLPNSDDDKAAEAPQPQDVAVLQALADHDPDVDAIYRMSQKLPVFFSKQGTAIVTPPQVYTPWNAQATFVRTPAFLGLLLPVTVSGRVTDIWRSYITMRLLWETKHPHVAFCSPLVSQYRNPHSYMKDFLWEDDLYKKSDQLLQLLSSWTSNDFRSLDEAFLSIIRICVQEEIYTELEYKLSEAWVQDLETIGYKWPEITQRQEPTTHKIRPVVDQRDMADAANREK